MGGTSVGGSPLGGWGAIGGSCSGTGSGSEGGSTGLLGSGSEGGSTGLSILGSGFSGGIGIPMNMASLLLAVDGSKAVDRRRAT